MTRGEWVVMAQDPPLAPGPHEIRVVQHVEGHAPVTSEQVVVAVVPTPADKCDSKKEDTLVMISPPSRAPRPCCSRRRRAACRSRATCRSRPWTTTSTARPPSPARPRPAPPCAPISTTSRSPRARPAPTATGGWRPADPIDEGEHRLRVDRLAPDGKPSARLELKFERQQTEPGDNRRLHVVRGDNLWNIARAHYGEGWRYTTIFDANKGEIRDPNLIYPGQVFSLPKVN